MHVVKIKLNQLNYQTFHLNWNGFEILNRSLPRNQINWFSFWNNEQKFERCTVKFTRVLPFFKAVECQLDLGPNLTMNSHFPT